ncbi:MAG: hypothetical protein HYZ20_11105 [Burkholderiales bacterium]|nr:hypothetical protein [Burkholderiales bacterium]
MGDLWAVLGAVGAVVLPMALAWWLLDRRPTRTDLRRDAHGKMPGEKER